MKYYQVQLVGWQILDCLLAVCPFGDQLEASFYTVRLTANCQTPLTVHVKCSLLAALITAGIF